jgi:hypothetical protein
MIGKELEMPNSYLRPRKMRLWTLGGTVEVAPDGTCIESLVGN